MKTLTVFIILALTMFSCSTSKNNIVENNKDEVINFSTEEGYDITVLDPQYDVFLKTIALPKEFYSETYYKNKNRFFVISWNSRYLQPYIYDHNLYSVRIDLEPNYNYGLDFEYKLFNFFKFIEWKYKIKLI